MTGPVAIVGAPSAIGLVPEPNGKPRRLDLAPGALRDAGVIERLSAEDHGDVESPPYRDLERPAGRVRNEQDLAGYCEEVAARVESCIRAGRFTVLLGGDCSIVLGALLALHAVDPAPPGLIYVDAHADFAMLDESPSGSACSMALGLALARDELPLTRLKGDEPLARADRTVHIGRRDHDASYGAAALEPFGVADLPMSAIAERGVARVADEALARAVAGGTGFWIHLDVDVLDPAAMPATGDQAPGGMDLAQAAALLVPLVQHPDARGLQLTLYDPTLDEDGRAAKDLVAMLERALG